MENNLQRTSKVNLSLFSKLFSVTRPQSSSNIYMRCKRWLAKILLQKRCHTSDILQSLIIFCIAGKNSKNGKQEWKWNGKRGSGL